MHSATYIVFIQYNLNPTSFFKNHITCVTGICLYVLAKSYSFFKIEVYYVDLSTVFLQEFAGEDTSDLFLEERETALRQAQEEKHKLQMSVPGILNPHEIPEEMCD